MHSLTCDIFERNNDAHDQYILSSYKIDFAFTCKKCWQVKYWVHNFDKCLQLGAPKRKGEKKMKVDEFMPLFAQVKKDKDAGSYEDFVEVLKLYDKNEDGTMMYAELEHILMSLGK